MWVRLMRSLELSRCEAGILVKLLSADGGRNNSPSSSLLELSAADPPGTKIDLTEKITDLGSLIENFDYSKLSNNRGVSNKRMVAYNFLDLLHKNARFW